MGWSLICAGPAAEVRLSGQVCPADGLPSRATGCVLHSPREIATVRRPHNHTPAELKRAVESYAVAKATDLYALAWRQAAGALPNFRGELLGYGAGS